MYKFTSYLTNAHLVLVRKQLGDGSCAALIVMRAPRRFAHFDNKCPTPTPTSKSRRFPWGTIGATVLTGAAVVYAKSNQDARNWLEANAPWANDFVALVYQENTTYWKFSVQQFNKISSWIGGFMFGKEGVTPMDFKQQSEQDLEQDAAIAYGKKPYKLPPPKFEPLYTEEKKIDTPEVETPATLIQTDKCEPAISPPIRITKDMVELEHDMHENTKLAVDNFKTATKFCKDYLKALAKIMESPVDSVDMHSLTALSAAKDARDRAATKATDAAAKAKMAIDTLDRMIKAGVQAPPETVAATLRYIKQFREDLSASEKDYKEEMDQCELSKRYWDKVEMARNAYKTELQILFPGIDLSSPKLELKGDTDLLLFYTLKQIVSLQSALAELQTSREVKINKAIECHDEKALIEAKVEDMIKKERFEKEREFQLKALQVQVEASKTLKEQLKRQFEIQQEVLQEKLKKKEQEIMAKFGRTVSEQVEAERVNFKRELAAITGKLQAIEQTVKQHGKAGEEARRSQSVWAAAEALLAATRRASPETNVDHEIQALEKAGQDDQLVSKVLKAIPPEVRQRGIATEKALRERFDAMEKTAMKVALIGREGATLPVYFLSWLQSKLLFVKLSEIPDDELDNQPTDFTKLDTFDIIQRARFHMNRNNLSAALRYVNLLQGAPRVAARGWVDAARSHLEVRQAAECVMAHATASGMAHM